MLRLTGCLLAIVLSSQAFATGAIVELITDADNARLEAYEATRDEAVEQARRNGSAEDLASMEKALFSPRLSINDLDLTGEWQCRTIKVGGIADLVVYSWFRCRVSDDGSGWWLEKLTGSQRTSGRFFTDSDTRLIYLGSGSLNDETPLPYGSGPDTDQAGYVFLTGDKEWHIEFPAPRYESKLDILELRR